MVAILSLANFEMWANGNLVWSWMAENFLPCNVIYTYYGTMYWTLPGRTPFSYCRWLFGPEAPV